MLLSIDEYHKPPRDRLSRGLGMLALGLWMLPLSVWIGLSVKWAVSKVTKERLVLERAVVSWFVKVFDQCKTCVRPGKAQHKVMAISELVPSTRFVTWRRSKVDTRAVTLPVRARVWSNMCVGAPRELDTGFSFVGRSAVNRTW